MKFTYTEYVRGVVLKFGLRGGGGGGCGGEEITKKPKITVTTGKMPERDFLPGPQKCK
jgi:hypothetical protein